METRFLAKVRYGASIAAVVLAVVALIFTFTDVFVAARIAGVATGIFIMLIGACDFVISTQPHERKRHGLDRFAMPIGLITFFLGGAILFFYLFFYGS